MKNLQISKTIKTLVTAATLVASGLAAAQTAPASAATPAPVATPVLQMNGIDASIKSVSVNADGTASIVLYNGTQKNVDLTSQYHQDLLGAAKELESAPLTTDRHFVTCMIVLPAYELQSLFVADSSGTMHLVMSPTTCAAKTFTHPTDQNTAQLAVNLKAELIKMAEQAITQ